MNTGHSNTGGRTEQFSRNTSLEKLLKEVNAGMWEAEKKMLPVASRKMDMPIILVMGPMRSGSTLFMQWLANTGLVAYPTNLLSRFYQAPILGAKIQQLLTDPRFNFRDELGEFAQQAEYKSENGKTKGVLAPNEFWYFWRRFLAEPSRDVWSDDELRNSMDSATMKAELVGLMDLFQKPFLAKGMLFNYNIPFLNRLFEEVIFVQLKRDPVMNIQSVLGAREHQLGSQGEWYSFDIPEKDNLIGCSPVEQVAGQVAYINRAVERGLQHVDQSRKMTVQYEDFCASPETFFSSLVNRIKIQGDCILQSYQGEQFFSPTDKLILSDVDVKKAIATYQACYQE